MFTMNSCLDTRACKFIALAPPHQHQPSSSKDHEENTTGNPLRLSSEPLTDIWQQLHCNLLKGVVTVVRQKNWLLNVRSSNGNYN